MAMKMKNKTYDVLKYICQIVLPAVLTLYGVIGSTLGIPYTPQVLTIGAAVIACLGECLKISTKNYNKKGEKKK